MVNISLLNIVLNYRLSDDLMTGHLNCLTSLSCVILGIFYDWIKLNMPIIKSVELHINVLSLHNRLNIAIIVDFFTGSSDGFCSCSLLHNRLSYNFLSCLVFRL